MFSLNAMLHEQAKIVVGLSSRVPSTSTPDYVSMKNYGRCCIIIAVRNATTVTGAAITLKQATAVAGTNEKALAFTKVYQNLDNEAAGGDATAETAVTSNTFTTDATNSKSLTYIIDVKAADLDINNGFDCIRVGAGDATAATVTVVYILYPADYAKAIPVSAIVD